MQNERSPGPDNITNEMLAHLGFQAKRKILGLFNTSWKTGLVPSNWKKAILIPILKVGKPKNKGNSYRPISLTSCMCKLMERMINKRLVWYLEKHNILMDEQAVFRQFRSTEDQVAYIAQTIEDGYQRQQHTVTVWVDMEKAFDRVWKKGLILQLMQAGVSHNMLKINNSLLEKENYPKYLGVTFDPRLTWCKQIETAQKNAVRRTLLLKKLAGTSWGADMKLLKKTYVGYVRPVMEYGIAAWGTASKTIFQKIERV
ncbi:Pol-like protein [Elysia marginata]|uniref:Pol-like protein n=1 Tax=Elysia marginata TaxID=1093978 RepID=A0AAV4H2J9_9GAST|nr:Pol-like protein [Elysia marginata]